MSEKNKKSSVSWFPDNLLESEMELIPLRILIAEDDPATRLIIERTLEADGYLITIATNGIEAWEALSDENEPPELAILDWMLPGIDGIDICKRVKERRSPFVFLILLTAKTESQDVVDGLDAGAHEFLTKPFDFNILRTRVAAGARIVRLEKALSMKNSILQDYILKLERETTD